MTAIRESINYEQKPGARYTILRDYERKEKELNKYLNTCKLQKQVNPEFKPKRSELISEMYEQKKVMKNRMCKRKGAQEYNFKKQSASRIISHTKTFQKENKFPFSGKTLSKNEIEHNLWEEAQEE
jgi:hypothetical protein